jgi:hypothetical protein
MDSDQGGPILVATSGAHGITGGAGLVRLSEEEDEEELVEQQMLVAPSDDEILRNIRSAIFGGSTA